MSAVSHLVSLSPEIESILTGLVDAARAAFGEDLKAFFLFGSGAEGRLRAVSDLNLLMVLTRFDAAKADLFREPLRTAQVAARAACMFVLEAELDGAIEAFAVKFDDISRRRRLLCGEDVFASRPIPRTAKKLRLRQVLLNLILRLRGAYVAKSLQEQALVTAVAESASPLRAAAATLLELQGNPIASPKAAMAKLVADFCGQGKLPGDSASWTQTLEQITTARTSGELAPGVARGLIFQYMAIAEQMLAQLNQLP